MERPQPEPPAGPPPMPWSILQIDGRTYIIDAQEKRLAVLFGSQAQREHVANLIMRVNQSHANRGILDTTNLVESS